MHSATQNTQREEPSSIRTSNLSGPIDPVMTERLILREYKMGDIDALYDLESIPEVAKYNTKPPYTREYARRQICDIISKQTVVPRILVEFAVTKHDWEFIGRVGALFKREDDTQMESGSHTQVETGGDTQMETDGDTQMETDGDTQMETGGDTQMETDGDTQMETGGNIGLETVSDESKILHASLWYSFMPKCERNGYATEAMTKFIALLGSPLRLEIECDPRNTRSVKMAERLGFEKISLTKKAYHLKGEWVDSVVFQKTV